MKRGRPINPLEYAPTGELYQGSQIRVLRDDAGLSVKELAVLVGRHPRALAKIETNGAKASEQLLQKIADHVGTSLDQLKRAPLSPKILGNHPIQRHAAEAPSPGTATVSAGPQGTSSSKDKNTDELVLAKLDTIIDQLRAQPRTTSDTADIFVRGGDWESLRQWSDARRSSTPSDVRDITDEQDLMETLRLTVRGVVREPGDGPAPEILSSFLRESSVFDSHPTDRQFYYDGLRIALDRGWDVIHVMRLTNNPDRVGSFVTNMLQLFGARGHYVPLLLPVGMVRGQPYDLLIVPTRGALELFGVSRSVEESSGVPIARFYPEGHPDYQRCLTEFIQWRERSLPLFTTYTPDFPEQGRPLAFRAFNRAVTDLEELDGERYLALNGLSEVTAPLWIHQARVAAILAQGRYDPSGIKDLLEQRRRRCAAFSEKVKTYRVRDLCPMSAIHRMLRYGEYSPDDSLLALGGGGESTDQVEAHLEAIIQLIDDPKAKYELMLLDKKDESICSSFLLLKVGYGAMIETPASDSATWSLGEALETRDLHMVGAFQRGFEDFWEKRFTPQVREQTRSFLIDALSLLRAVPS